MIKEALNSSNSIQILVEYKDKTRSHSNIEITEEEQKKINNVLDLISISKVKK